MSPFSRCHSFFFQKSSFLSLFCFIFLFIHSWYLPTHWVCLALWLQNLFSLVMTYGYSGWLVHRICSQFLLSATVYLMSLSKTWLTFSFHYLLCHFEPIHTLKKLQSSIYPASTNLVSTYKRNDSLVRSILSRKKCAITIVPTLFPYPVSQSLQD